MSIALVDTLLKLYEVKSKEQTSAVRSIEVPGHEYIYVYTNLWYTEVVAADNIRVRAFSATN